MATFEDVTAKREAESRLVNLALTDPLTGLGNRTQFEQSVMAAIIGRTDSTAATPAILMIDLDRFKAVNDTLGHPTGDGLLRIVAQRLQSAAGKYGMTARLGGDEFAILINSGMPLEELAGLAGRIIDFLKRTFLVNGHSINIGASIGIAIAPKDGDTRELLMKSADLALYHSKDCGRSGSIFLKAPWKNALKLAAILNLNFEKHSLQNSLKSTTIHR